MPVIAQGVRACTRCALHLTRANAVPGAGPPNARIMLVGEAPGKNGEATGEPFCGVAGRILDGALEKAGLLREQVFITSVLKCRPPQNRNPHPEEMRACAPWLDAQIASINPSLVVLMGNIAVQRFFPQTKSAQVKEMRGKFIMHGGRTFFVASHPAAVIYRRRLQGELEAQFKRAARRAKH